jgi:acyl-[acyl-carrier-protein]-phospholipid O-acyltransferase/long-chain-fatty-acid--[acyl-carrier-protein] ligase
MNPSSALPRTNEPSPRGWCKPLSPFWILFILTGLNLLNYLDRSVLNAVRTPLATDLKIDYGDSGRTVTAFMIGYFVTSPFFGYLGDRFSRKWLIAFGIFVWSLGTVLTGYASGFAVLLGYRALVGLGEASYATISPSLISDAFGALKRNNALTIFYVAIPVGSALGYLVGGEVSAHWGWRHAFIWAGLPGLLLALILLPFEEPRRGQSELGQGEKVAKPTFRDFLKLFANKDYQLIVWGYVAYTFAIGAFAFWGPTFLEKVHLLSTAVADRFFGAVLVFAGLIGTLVGGFVATQWQKKSPAGYAWMLCGSILVAAPVALAAFLATRTWVVMSLLALAMFLMFLSTGPVNTLIIECVPLNLRASAMALSIFMIHLFGDMWSPEIVGRLADAWGHDLRKGVLILPLMLVIGGMFWLLLALRRLEQGAKQKSVTYTQTPLPLDAKDVNRANAAETPETEPPRASRINSADLWRWMLRLLVWFLTHLVYRVRVLGREHIPKHGGALLVCNHLSQVDALLLQASVPRQIRFIMYKGIYESPWIKPLALFMKVIPISSEQRPREMIQSLRDASDAIKAGEIVCIFAEGQITRIGQMLPFRRGFERIMKDAEAPIVPVALDDVWGSIFSFQRGRFIWKFPRRIPYPVTVNFGQALPKSATSFEVRRAVQELVATAWPYRKSRMRPLHRAFIRTARGSPFRFAMADSQTPKVTFGSALVRTLFLARRLRTHLAGQGMVGILLPPSVPGALVNLATLMLGRTPVNLNYTLSEEAVTSCIRQCGIKTVITSKAFLEKIKLKLPNTINVFLEEIVANPKFTETFATLANAWLLPTAVVERTIRLGVPPPEGHHPPSTSIEDLATIIFSSGSTGEPKGVMLTHYNIRSNIDQLNQVFGLTRFDRILGILPFFHSFGFTGTLCLPAVLGIGVAYHPNPLDAKGIGPLISRYRLTFMLATPTFLQIYLRGCSPEDFGSLRVVMTGAEKLPDRLAAAFEEGFGIRPLEGYGCTECGPVVSVNTSDFRSPGFRQVGAKRGKIGHPVPGMSVRVIDPNGPLDGPSLPIGQAGLLLVRGPNVMRGYLARPDKTAEVLRNEWYVTGDIAALDEDGFLQITDRLSRFSKIGGEMVPHVKIEEKLHELTGSTEPTFAVAGVPDAKKGERLVVLHKLADAQLQACLQTLAQSDLPNLWKPRPDQFFHIDAMPYLGTGKLDLRKVRELATHFSVACETPEAGLQAAEKESH